jgi:DNA-binding NarL/FixJ family response regulator
MTASAPVRLALVDDYEIVLVGVAHMFDQYRHRVEVVDIAPERPIREHVDIVLYDTFAQSEADDENLDVLVANEHADKVVVYTWSFQPELIEAALARGASGYLAKTLSAAQLVDALERIHTGETVVSSARAQRGTVGLDWPGREEGLTERESEIMALITQGKSNAEIGALTYLSINSIKTHIRNAYRKVGVSTRSQAVLWGVDHGFRISRHHIDAWR